MSRRFFCPGYIDDDDLSSDCIAFSTMSCESLGRLHRRRYVYWAGIGVPVLKPTASARAFERRAARAYINMAHVVMAIAVWGDDGLSTMSRRCDAYDLNLVLSHWPRVDWSSPYTIHTITI